MISMGQRMAMLPGTQGRSEWMSLVQATGVALPGESNVTEADIVARLILDPEIHRPSRRAFPRRARTDAPFAPH